MQPFTIRSASSQDLDFVIYSWLKSYARSRYGRARRAHVAASSEELAYWAEHRPVVQWLLRTGELRVACDATAPDIVWGWCCTGGPAVLHYVLVKRVVHRVGLSGDIYRALLGDRLERPQLVTHELVDMQRQELIDDGVTVPASWVLADQRREAD